MLRWSGLWRPVARRARADAAFLLAIWLPILTATTLLAAGTLYADVAESGGLRAAVLNAAATDRAVTVSLGAPADDLPALDAQIRPLLADALAGTEPEIYRTLRSSALVPIGTPTGQGAQHLTALGANDDLEQHATLTGGRWPQPGQDPAEAVLSDGAAAAVGLAIGDQIGFADASDPSADRTTPVVSVVIVGSWKPSPADAYWQDDRLDLNGIRSDPVFTYRGPFMVAADDLLAISPGTKVTAAWRGLSSATALRVSDSEQLVAAIQALPDAVQAVPGAASAAVGTSFADVLNGINRSTLVSRSGVLLVTLQFGVVAAYAAFLVGGMLAERRRAEVALLRSRGASTLEVGVLALGEALVLVVPAVVIAPWLGLVVVNAVGRFGTLGDVGVISASTITAGSMVVAILAGLFCLAALTLPTLVAELDLARVRAALGRPVGRNLAQRLGIDLLLLALAVIGLFQLRTYGAPLIQNASGELTLDPLLIAAPAIGLAAGAILAIRLVPRLGELAERLFVRAPGLTAPLSAREIARRPLRYTRTALLLVLAASLGTFAAVSAATWSRSQEDQAAYASGTDLRVTLPQQQGPSAIAMGTAIRAIPGVDGAVPVNRFLVDVARTLRSGPLIAVTPEALASMVRADAAGSELAERLHALADAREPNGAIPIPGTPRRLGLSIDSSFVSREPGATLADPLPGIEVTALILDGDGHLRRTAPQTALLNGSGQHLEIPLTVEVGGNPQPMTYPLSLYAVELIFSSPVLAVGETHVSALDASPDDTSDTWSPVITFADRHDWVLNHSLAPGNTRSLITSRPAGDIVYTDELPLVPMSRRGYSDEEGADVWRMWAPPPEQAVVPAIASDSFLTTTGASVGDTIPGEVHLSDVALKFVGTMPTFPSLDPTQPFVVVDAQSLDVARYRGTASTDAVSEWWLDTDSGQGDGVAAALKAAPFSASTIVDRATLTRSLESDPVALGTIGALVLGSLAAISFALVGFLVSSLLMTRERLGELALLRALGLSGRQLVGWLSLENSFLLALGLVSGAVLGIVIGLLVLPYSTLTSAGRTVVPQPVVVVPLEALVAIGVLGIIALVISVVLGRREVRRSSIVDVLRARED